MASSLPNTSFDPWPHRLAIVLCCATFPLIWVGGMVTTYDAGMAVPDWPSTYGYNLFRYPWQTWLFGPFDLLIEHGHRLLGATVGFLSIGFAVVTWLRDDRRWMRGAALVAFGMVLVQGLLGGARVRLDERGLAMVHGCFGLATFGYLAAMAVVTSRFWRLTVPFESRERGARLQRFCVLTAAIVYVQIVLGALLRHVPVGAPPRLFQVAVLFHLLFAGAVLFHAVLLARRAFQELRDQPKFLWPATALLIMVLCQLALGGSTWVLKYGWPGGLGELSYTAGFTVAANSWIQAGVTTAHVALGALIFSTSVVLSLRVARCVRPAALTASSGALLMGWTT